MRCSSWLRTKRRTSPEQSWSSTAASSPSEQRSMIAKAGTMLLMLGLAVLVSVAGAADVSARTMAEELGKVLKVPVVVVNRPGGGMTIGTDSVVKAKKDGYTILFTTNAALVSNRIINPDTVSYDPLKDLTPLGLATRTPILIAVRSDAPYKTFGEMVEFAKKNPGQVRVGTVGVGSAGHLDVELINSLTGAGLTMVPF